MSSVSVLSSPQHGTSWSICRIQNSYGPSYSDFVKLFGAADESVKPQFDFFFSVRDTDRGTRTSQSIIKVSLFSQGESDFESCLTFFSAKFP